MTWSFFVSLRALHVTHSVGFQRQHSLNISQAASDDPGPILCMSSTLHCGSVIPHPRQTANEDYLELKKESFLSSIQFPLDHTCFTRGVDGYLLGHFREVLSFLDQRTRVSTNS